MLKKNLTRDILECVILFGVISVAATSPYFLYNIMKIIMKSSKLDKTQRQKFRSAFYCLKRNNMIFLEKDGHDIRIFATKKGEAKFKKYKFSNLKIKIPRKWDKKFRIISFDIPNSRGIQRNAFRAKLKELGFYSTQKSVWIHPYNCIEEIKVLMEFLGLTDKQVQIFTAEKIEDKLLLEKIKKIYKI
jgi:DNA-binding transcriptional regulator PaaX